MYHYLRKIRGVKPDPGEGADQHDIVAQRRPRDRQAGDVRLAAMLVIILVAAISLTFRSEAMSAPGQSPSDNGAARPLACPGESGSTERALGGLCDTSTADRTEGLRSR